MNIKKITVEYEDFEQKGPKSFVDEMNKLIEKPVSITINGETCEMKLECISPMSICDKSSMEITFYNYNPMGKSIVEL